MATAVGSRGFVVHIGVAYGGDDGVVAVLDTAGAVGAVLEVDGAAAGASVGGRNRLVGWKGNGIERLTIDGWRGRMLGGLLLGL